MTTFFLVTFDDEDLGQSDYKQFPDSSSGMRDMEAFLDHAIRRFPTICVRKVEVVKEYVLGARLIEKE